MISCRLRYHSHRTGEPASMHPIRQTVGQQANRVRQHARSDDASTMFDVLTGPMLLDRVARLLPEHRERLYPPTRTLSMFIAQVLSADGSCQQAVDAAQVARLVDRLEPGCSDTGAYCKARARLPLSMISTLARECGGLLTEQTPNWWQWRGRRVLLVDGLDHDSGQPRSVRALLMVPAMGAPTRGRSAQRTLRRYCNRSTVRTGKAPCVVFVRY